MSCNKGAVINFLTKRGSLADLCDGVEDEPCDGRVSMILLWKYWGILLSSYYLLSLDMKWMLTTGKKTS